MGGLLRRIGVWALYATALTPLVFSPRTIYPYVVPRAFYFRVLVAGAAAVSLYLLATRTRKGAARGPARDLVLLALGALVAVQLVAALAGEAPLRSLFGDMERMEGVIAWLHFLAFYVAMRTLLGEREIVAFLWLTVVAATIVSAVALVQAAGVPVGILPGPRSDERAISTIGNPGYLAIYALFAMAVAALLAGRARRAAPRVAAAAVLAVNAAGLALTWTRAALAGLGAGLLLGLVAYAAMAESRPRRRWSLVAVGGLLLLGGVAGSALWSRPGAGFRGAERLANVSALERSLGFRYFAWKAGARAVADDPLTGLGMENFRLAFDRKLQPEEFGVVTHYTRAHNDFVEFTVAGGIPGGLAWVGVWAALFYVLLAARREGKLGPGETAVLGGTFAAYLVYLLFWFHEPNSLPVFLALAAYVGLRRDGPYLGSGPSQRSRVASRRVRAGIALTLALVVTADLAHHGRLLAAGHHLLRAEEGPGLEARIEHYERALELNPPGPDEAVTVLVQFATQLAGAVGQRTLDPGTSARIGGFLERGRAAMAAQLAADPGNPRLHRDAGRLHVAIFQMTRQPAYLDSATAHLERAIELAPARLRYRHMLSEIRLMEGRPEEAVRVLEEGLAGYDRHGETHYFLAKALLVGGSLEEAADALIRAYELGYRDPNPAVRQALIRGLRERGADETVARLREARRAAGERGWRPTQ